MKNNRQQKKRLLQIKIVSWDTTKCIGQYYCPNIRLWIRNKRPKKDIWGTIEKIKYELYIIK